MAKQTYILTCEKCREPFYSKEAFPDPQLCPKCLEPQPDERLREETQAFLAELLIEFKQRQKDLSLEDVCTLIDELEVKYAPKILSKAQARYDKPGQGDS